MIGYAIRARVDNGPTGQCSGVQVSDFPVGSCGQEFGEEGGNHYYYVEKA